MGLTRAVGLIVVLIALVLGGALLTMQGTSGATSPAAVSNDETQAALATASADFGQVTEVLQGNLAQTGSYAGAQLPVGSQVTLAQANTTGYCLEANISGTLVHETGPGGTAASGPC